VAVDDAYCWIICSKEMRSATSATMSAVSGVETMAVR
jgi:hypothetical protein